MADDRLISWPEQYARKLMTTTEAMELIRDGDGIIIPVGTATPSLDAAIVRVAPQRKDLSVWVMAPTMVHNAYFESESIHAVAEAFVSSPQVRKAINEQRSSFTPVPLSMRMKSVEERGLAVHKTDVLLVSVSPPDQFGFCSLGVGGWNKKSIARNARVVLAEINPSHPRVHGDNAFHVSEITAFVEADTAMPPMVPAGAVPPPALHPGIVEGVRSIVHDGDTIQIGTGDRTNLLVTAGTFDDKEDLGYHAELCVGGTNDLVRKGIITGARKTLHRGKFVATQLLATSPEDIEFINDNPIYEVYPVEYTNHPLVIAQNENMVAINNALAIDFLGQITAESIDGKLWSGHGGQPEFAIGSMLAKGGRNVTVLESTARGGTVSRIMPGLPEGTAITVQQQFADYIVTEYGVARLYGKSYRERAEELIAIAHPDFRGELRKAAAGRYIPK